MLGNADKDITEAIRLFSSRVGAVGYLMPTDAGLAQSFLYAGGQVSGYFRRSGLHDYATQPIGIESKIDVRTWIVQKDRLVESVTSLYRPEENGDKPGLWINGLNKYAQAGSLLALLLHEADLYVVNTSDDEVLMSAGDPGSPLGRVLDLLASSKSQPLDDKFSEWNLRLLRSFFSEASRGEEVFLRVDQQLLDQIGQDIGGDSGFLDAVRTGPIWAMPRTSLVERTESLVKQRKSPAARRPSSYKDPGELDLAYRGVFAPTYLPYLAALVRNDSEHPTSYYDGLRTDLKLGEAFGSIEMEMMEVAWRDLEEWTSQNQGRFGQFTLRVLGGYSRIGVPRSQSILQQGDVEDISRAFVQAEVRPGHEISEQEITRILHEVQASQRQYSAAFRSALGKRAFEQPIRTAIAAAYMDWDGTIPASNRGGQGPKKESIAGAPTETGIGLCLAVVHQDPLRLAPLWCVPPLQDSGHFRLVHSGGLDWAGSFVGTEGAASKHDPGKEDAIWRIAEQVYEAPAQFEIECYSSDDLEPTRSGISLPEKCLWILTPFDGLCGDIELREGDLPGSGQAYLLASPRNVPRLKDYLQRLRPEHELITVDGLPTDWLLVCIRECATLSNDQRLLPDGEDSAHPKPRAIRFVGGRSVRRGYSKMYLPYDLPVIELDARDGAMVECPAGLRLSEETSHCRPRVQTHTLFRPRKRFRIELASSSSASYEISATLDGTILGQAKLRIAGIGGEMVDIGQSFSLDNVGHPLASREGLSGVLPTLIPGELTDESQSDQLFKLSARRIELFARQDARAFGVQERFLDSLAQSGSLDYGVARDQIERLFVSVGDQGDPTLVLLDLRSRGHIEIATTHKGHFSRIHAVEPTIFELPAVLSGRRAYGVTGTLRLSHWDQMANESLSWTSYQRSGTERGFKPLLLLADNPQLVRLACDRLKFRFASNPALAVAVWSADVNSVRNEMLRNPMESIGSAQDGAMRFNAGRGIFTARPTRTACELYRVRDLDTGMDNVYVLSDKGKFAFMRDSRWGIWIALDAFSRWASELPGMSGVHPIPVTYSRDHGVLWLPARISLPFILERALILCAGDAPEVLRIQHVEREAEGDRINLFTNEDAAPVLSVNCFYNEMAKGKWLAYRYVPHRIASLIADKLGASIDLI